ncbi:uncharacterized protein LOC129981627 [Argiope bruennichi]|uniref:uncharacterized protein LOC129981627 n=1 Tax=Argiope bruennichi TaxID=94029 RepID=UPI002494F2FE|nr:uncharacterized protein LOC129981627 [Argiope bruennichi]
MAKLAAIFLMCLSLQCAWSYYDYTSRQSYQPKVIYRHHVAPYQPRATAMHPVHIRPVPMSPYGSMAIPFGRSAMPFQAMSAAPMSYWSPPQSMFNHMPYSSPAASQHSGYFSSSPLSPPSVPRFPINDMVSSYNSHFNPHPSKPSFLTKIKPFLFGNSGPRSLPHDPYYPNHFPPHQFAPNKPFQNRPSAHHAYPVYSSPVMHHSHGMMSPEKSCSCSLHVGQLTVYKHTDMRSSYSCDDLKDCNSFCTNLFSSEDLRAQTRSDACLIIGKDVTVPWFRRDHVCEPHGVKNDTKLSVDLCCKNLQPC